MNAVGWVRTEMKLGSPKWHYFTGTKSDMSIGGARHKSLCGQSAFYVLEGKLETRHITSAGNCRTCMKILIKRDSGQAGMTNMTKGETA